MCGLDRPLGWIVLLCLIGLCSARLEAAADPPPTMAVLAEQAGGGCSTISSLLEMRLAKSSQVRLVERPEIDKVLKEQPIARFFGPDAGRGRVELGRILRADILVLLRPLKAERPAMELVACETSSGLRLCRQSLPISADPAADAAILDELVREAMRRRETPITEICAVPPFVGNDLGFDYDHLKSAYAQLVEQMLLECKGVLVVELAEAQAIAIELAVANGPAIQRPLPLYILGEYRNEGTGESRRISVSIKVKRGEQSLETIADPSLAPVAVPGFLRQHVGAALDQLVGAAPSPPAPDEEARQLAERAMLFQRLGNWEQAIALIEASLLIKPDQEEMHRQAVIALTPLAKRYLWGGPQTLDRARLGIVLYFRGLEHLETFLRTAGSLEEYHTLGKPDFIADFNHSANAWKTSGNPSKELLDALADAHRRETAILLRIARQRARDGRGDDTRFVVQAVFGLPDKELYELLYQMLIEFKDLPGGADRARRYASHGYTLEVLDCPEEMAFLDKVAAIDNPEMRAAVAELKTRLPEYRALGQQFRERVAARTQPAPPDSAALRDVVFLPLLLRSDHEGPPRAIPLKGLLPARAGLDIAWDSKHVYLMKEKGRLETVWAAPATPPENNIWINSVCFDGRYVWVGAWRFAQRPPLLMAIEASSGKINEFTADDGLPVAAPGVLDKRETQTVTAAPLAPGRACVAGWFGHSWIAIASVEAPGGEAAVKSINIFHEAREAPNREDRSQWQRTTMSFTPQVMVTVSEKAAPGTTPRQRVLVARDARNSEAWFHPLLVDPENRSVTVVRDKIFPISQGTPPNPQGQFLVEDGFVYWACPAKTDRNSPAVALWRIGFPDFAAESVAECVYEYAGMPIASGIASYHGQYFVTGHELWAAPSATGPYCRISGPFAARALDRAELLPSAHYGLLLRVALRNEIFTLEPQQGPKAP